MAASSSGVGAGRAPPASARGDPWALLLEQASDLNDELCRENCELKSEVAILRQRQMQREAARSRGKPGASMAARVASLTPRVMSHVRRMIREVEVPPEACGEALRAVVEEAVRATLAAAADSACGGEVRALASDEETAALVQEKVTLKEFSVAQQERLVELELAREKLAESTAGQRFSLSSLTSALQVSLSDAAAAMPQTGSQYPAPASEPLPPALPAVAVGDHCEVVGKKGAIIRATEDLDSPEVATLLPGTRALVLELGKEGSRRARVRSLDPVAGDAAGPAAGEQSGGATSSTALRPRGAGEGPEPPRHGGPLAEPAAEAEAEDPQGGGEPPTLQSPPPAEGSAASEAEAGAAADGASAPEGAAAELAEGAAAAAPEDAGGTGGATAAGGVEGVCGTGGTGGAAAGGGAAAAEGATPGAAEDPAGLGRPLQPAGAFPEGWLSVSTKTGKALVRPLVVDEAVNDEGATIALGTAEGWTHLYYCGRFFGTDIIPGSDGRCGPADGPQCPSCRRYRDRLPDACGSVEAPSAASSSAADLGAPSCESTAPSLAECPAQAGGAQAPASSSASTPRGPAEAGAPQGAEDTAVARPPAAPPSSTVTVSTDAWLNLRKERNERERHIKVLQAQVDTAQQELAELARVRAKLREQRQLALEARCRGKEMHEAARMAEEEMHTLRLEAHEAAEEERAAEAAREEAAQAAAAAREAEEAAERERAAAVAADSAAQAEAEAERARSIEWQRLLSERETTARELGATLQQIEELELTLEERRIDLQLVEKRREKERRSLLDALRELRGGAEPEGGAGWEEEAVREEASAEVAAEEAEPPSPNGLSAEKERRYLQKISELEELISGLRSQLAEVQAREAALNRSAQTRGAALRYATASVAAGVGSSPAEGSLLAGAGVDSPWGEQRRWQGRADLEGLTDMLDRLFVENFALRNGSQPDAPAGGLAGPSGGPPRGSPAGPAEAPPATAPRASRSPSRAQALDLSRFVRAGAASDDEEDGSSSGSGGSPSRRRRISPAAPAPQARGGGPASAAPARPAGSAAEGEPGRPLADPYGPLGAAEPVSPLLPARPPQSPRSLLLSGLDFAALGVAE